MVLREETVIGDFQLEMTWSWTRIRRSGADHYSTSSKEEMEMEEERDDGDLNYPKNVQ